MAAPTTPSNDLPKQLRVKLTPKASADRIGEVIKDAQGHDALQVYVTAPPDKNKANEALIRLLAKHYGIAPSRICLVSGQTSRNKLLSLS